MRLSVFLLWALLTAPGCSRTDPAPAFGDLIGSWRLYEVGGSPGSGYYVTPISAAPPQYLTFTNKNELHQQGKDIPYIFDVPTYRIELTQYGRRLILLKNRSDQTGFGVAFQIRNDTLRITPTCYEGCHYGFVRMQ